MEIILNNGSVESHAFSDIDNVTFSGQLIGEIITIDCAGATTNGTLISAVAANGVTVDIDYTGGNSGAHLGQTVISTGVTGLTAELIAGNFVSGIGVLNYTIIGTPNSSGTATFVINIGGQICNLEIVVDAGTISTLDCAGATINGVLTGGVTASITADIDYTGGNSGSHNGQTVTSTGVTGLTAVLPAGNFLNGAGILNYTIFGAPNSSGTATFALDIGGETCNLDITVGSGAISTLDCAAATVNGSLINGVASSVAAVIDYTGGNSGSHNGQTVISTGVTGLTATLAAGNFANGAGTLTYSISGTASSIGTATFALNIGGQTCSFDVTIVANPYPAGYMHCGSATAVVDVTGFGGEIWMDRNLGASRAAQSSTDVQSYGSSYQWGRGADGHQCVNRFAGDGVTTSGNYDGDANGFPSTVTASGAWDGLFILCTTQPELDWLATQNSNLWQGVNGVNNPCPTGYRLPTEAEWVTESSNWSQNGAGAYASPLKMTLAGGRSRVTGGTTSPGATGYNHTSTIVSTVNGDFSRFLQFGGGLGFTQYPHSNGFSVRCIKD